MFHKTWHVRLRPEKTKPCTFPAKSHYGFRREREKWVAETLFFVTCKTHHFCHFPWIDFRQGSRHMVSHFRKVSIKGSNFPKNRLFRVQNGTLFVPRLRVTGNVLRRLDCFHPLVDIPQIYPSKVTFAEGCIVYQLSTSKRLRILCHGISNGGTCMPFFQTYSPGGADRRFALVTTPVHINFYPCDAMLARVFATATCPSVCLSVWTSVTRRYCA